MESASGAGDDEEAVDETERTDASCNARETKPKAAKLVRIGNLFFMLGNNDNWAAASAFVHLLRSRVLTPLAVVLVFDFVGLTLPGQEQAAQHELRFNVL